MIIIDLKIIDTCKPEEQQTICSLLFPAESIFVYANWPITIDSERVLTYFKYTPTIMTVVNRGAND